MLVVFPALPAGFPAPVICVQHMHPRHPSYLVDILARRCALPVEFVADGVMPRPGVLMIAPPDHHVVIEADGRLGLRDGPPVNHVRPAADLLFSTAAEVLGERAVAVVLSGTGHDGAAGAAAVRQAGGRVVVQSPGSCEFPGMVEATTRAVEPDVVVPVGELAAAFERLAAEVPR